jgi:hypothetical protein
MTRWVIANRASNPHDRSMTIHDTDTTTARTTTIDTHLAAYCEPDAERRAAMVASVWAPDGALVDPPFDGVGHDGIAAMTDVVLTHYPNHTFRRVTDVDTHHTVARYGWELVDADGAVAVGGTDFVDFDEEGRLTRVVGFFGELTPT